MRGPEFFNNRNNRKSNYINEPINLLQKWKSRWTMLHQGLRKVVVY